MQIQRLKPKRKRGTKNNRELLSDKFSGLLKQLGIHEFFYPIVMIYLPSSSSLEEIKHAFRFGERLDRKGFQIQYTVL